MDFIKEATGIIARQTAYVPGMSNTNSEESKNQSGPVEFAAKLIITMGVLAGFIYLIIHLVSEWKKSKTG